MTTYYVQLTKAPGKDYNYELNHYTKLGEFVMTTVIKLADIDKLCPKHIKLRVNGKTWALMMNSGKLFPCGAPEFSKADV